MGVLNAQTVKTGLKIAGRACKRYLPSILIGFGVGGMFVGTIVAVQATPEAHEELEKQRQDEEQVAEMMEREPKKDIWARAKIIGKHYWPTALIMTTSAGCIIFANSVHLKREAALIAAYHLSTKNLEDLKEKIVELDGKKKLTKLTDAISQDDLDKNPTDGKTMIITGNGEHLCYDAWSGRYFQTNIEKVRRAELDMNKALLRDGYYSLNDFYESLDLPVVELGNLLGWHCDSTDHQVEINFSSKVTDKGEPCLVIRFDILPEYEFDNFG